MTVARTKTAIVSGCDANFFPLLLELIASIGQFEQSRDTALCIIDAGLESGQAEHLRTMGAHVVKSDWPEGIDATRTQGKDYLKACICRPFIPDLFPGYEMYLWLDADTWVQEWSAVEMFVAGASKGDRIALTSTADRSYSKSVRIKWLGNWPYKIKNFYSSNGRAPFGNQFAKHMVSEYVLLAGCFALAGSAPHWRHWQNLVIKAANKGKIFSAEQVALGKMVLMDGYKAELLPAYAHWLCVRTPLWDKDRRRLVEPFTPHQPLGILHLSGVDDLRADRTVEITLETTDGGQVAMNLRYPAFDGGAVALSRPKRA